MKNERRMTRQGHGRQGSLLQGREERLIITVFRCRAKMTKESLDLIEIEMDDWIQYRVVYLYMFHLLVITVFDGGVGF